MHLGTVVNKPKILGQCMLIKTVIFWCGSQLRQKSRSWQGLLESENKIRGNPTFLNLGKNAINKYFNSFLNNLLLLINYL